MGWEFGGQIAGHLIGHFPHEKLEKENKTNYIHPDNLIDMNTPDKQGNTRHWILEIHFVDPTYIMQHYHSLFLVQMTQLA